MQYRPEDRVKVQLKIDKSLLGYPGSPSDYYVAVTGSGLQLGNNNPNIAPRCKQVGRNLWMKEIWPTKYSDIKFRFLVVKRSNNVIVDIENTEPRSLSIEGKPIIVDVRFNKQRITAKEIDEITRCNKEPQYSRGNSHASSIKANIRAHQNVRNQPKYSLKPNTQWKEPKLEVKLMPPVSQRVKDELILIRRRQEEKQMHNTNERSTVTGESAATLTTNDSRPTKAMMTCNLKPVSTTTAGDIPLTATVVMTSDAGPLTTEMVSNTKQTIAEAANTSLLTTAVSTIRSEEDINGELIRKNNLEATGKSSLCKEEESRRTEVETTSSEWRPSARALLLTAAGVVAATCVGYYYFVKK